ncbi:Trm112 family protein [Tunturiibacter psychrotolerans]|uniref:Trm112 family protein n=1 Tax=Tunturiibacter psychrotolerans TaxID=3069686 RepID=UPI00333FD02D
MSAESLPATDLRWVVCPVCHQPLESVGNIISCQGCGRRYPVLDGIPVLLADRVL